VVISSRREPLEAGDDRDLARVERARTRSAVIWVMRAFVCGVRAQPDLGAREATAP
jgi:hypothetical protein